MNTTENNKIIAEFMGAIEVRKDNFKFPNRTGLPLQIGTINYHSDWNWLMEVVEKIETLKVQDLSFNFNIQKDRVSLSYIHINDPKKSTEMFFEWGQKTKIENLYKIVLEFIKWYNENK